MFKVNYKNTSQLVPSASFRYERKANERSGDEVETLEIGKKYVQS